MVHDVFDVLAVAACPCRKPFLTKVANKRGTMHRAVLGLIAAAFSASASSAQGTIPIGTLLPVAATTSEPLGLILGIKHLSDGRLLVNDAGGRRLVLFDPTLTRATVVADTTDKAPLNYGPNPTPLIPYLGDSSLFLDRRALAFQLLDGQGRAVRTMALPKASDTPLIWGGRVLADGAGRLVYRGLPHITPVKDTGQALMVTHPADSAPIVRADFDKRSVDTLGIVKLPLLYESRRARRTDGTFATTIALFGLSWIDDWVMTSDGAIAIVRGQDYHIDWVMPDGRRISTPRMQIDWRRIDDAEKRHLADSAANEVQTFFNERRAQQQAAGNAADKLRIVARADIATGTMQVIPYDATITAPLDRIPDYQPPVRAGAVKADRDGNVWILPATSAQATTGALVYDVVNRNGQVTQRVAMPAGRSIVDFGPGGIVYLMFKDGAGAWHLERTKLAAGERR